nr:rhodanese-like domain-containing protein [uncultured Campylobacter sp.]
MRKILLLGAAAAMAFAEISTVQVSPEAIKNYEQIVDIRTPAEWMETGVIKGAKTITFNATDKEGFLNELKANVDLKKPVALICRSGRRSAAAAMMIDSPELNIINLDGGMGSLINQGYETTPYQK